MLVAWWVACTEPDDGAGPPPAGPTVAFDLSPGAALFDAPFPSEHRRRPDGTIDVADWPNPDGNPLVDDLVTLADAAPGFGTTSGVMFRLDAAVHPVDVFASAEADAPAFLVAVDGPRRGERAPIDLFVADDGGPFGADHLLTLLPLQGAPLAPDTTWAAVLTRGLGADRDLGVPPALWSLAHGGHPRDVPDAAAAAYRDALDALADDGLDPEDVAGLAVFRTWDPTRELLAVTQQVRAAPAPTLRTPLALTDVFDTYCVFASELDLPVFQGGEPPYATEGGGWVLDADGRAVQQGVGRSRLWLTVPRSAAPARGWPVAVMVRTGGGGDRPLVDRGVRDADGVVAIPGSGPALDLTAAGFVGVQVDGPHGGPYRNPSGADEQFLMFSVTNPVATRDNVRQSALELALLPDVLAGVALDLAGCPGADRDAALDLDTMALFGHSMGATIAPLVVAASPAYDATILSGAGGSYAYNLVYKESPIAVRPVAEALLGFTSRGRTLREDDPVLQLLQWVSEPADPPVYAALADGPTLMVQGIVDTYILPPMANAASLSLGLSLGGAALDADEPRLSRYRALAPLQPLVGAGPVALPARGEARVVVQVAEDGIEDGHEVIFQTEGPKHQVRCLLAGLAADDPVIAPPGAVDAPCP